MDKIKVLKTNMKWLLIVVLPLIIIMLMYYIAAVEPESDGVLKLKKTLTEEVEPGDQMNFQESSTTIEEDFAFEMSELAVQNAIHHMSHQKVEADKKWGVLPLTKERVDRLLEVVQHNRNDYKYGSVYEEILLKWQNNNFTSVDDDHNTIWELQDGSVGRATGILSAKEEQAFIEEKFSNRQ
ncbi:MAG: DUF6241 domain-containing protein [Bacillota bacterium]